MILHARPTAIHPPSPPPTPTPAPLQHVFSIALMKSGRQCLYNSSDQNNLACVPSCFVCIFFFPSLRCVFLSTPRQKAVGRSRQLPVALLLTWVQVVGFESHSVPARRQPASSPPPPPPPPPPPRVSVSGWLAMRLAVGIRGKR